MSAGPSPFAQLLHIRDLENADPWQKGSDVRRRRRLFFRVSAVAPVEEVAMSNAIRSVLAALACSEVEIPRTGLCGLKGVVPTGTAPFAVREVG
jgi:hypothetical protein